MGSDKAKAYGAERREEFVWISPERLTVVGVDTKEDQAHPLYDERAKWPVNDKLVRSILARGFTLEGAITVRKNGEDDHGTPFVEVIDGRQRVKAARTALELLRSGYEMNGVKHQPNPDAKILIPCLTKRGEAGDLAADMVTGNVLRIDDNPVVRGRKAQRLMRFGHSEEDVACINGTSLVTVRNWLQILECAPEVIEAVALYRLPASIAKQMLGIPHEEQSKLVKKMLADGKTSGKEAEEEVEKVKKGRGRTRASRGKVVGRRAVETIAKKAADAFGDTGTREQKMFMNVLAWFQGDPDALVEYEWVRELLADARKKKGARVGKKRGAKAAELWPGALPKVARQRVRQSRWMS